MAASTSGGKNRKYGRNKKHSEAQKRRTAANKAASQRAAREAGDVHAGVPKPASEYTPKRAAPVPPARNTVVVGPKPEAARVHLKDQRNFPPLREAPRGFFSIEARAGSHLI